MADEPKRVFLGVVSTDADTVTTFDFPADATAAEIADALAAFEAKRAADAIKETARLNEIFLGRAAVETKDGT
jgi:hypothetical protein